MGLSVVDIRRIINPTRTSNIASDDFRIIDSWADYVESGSSIDDSPLDFLCYELETINPKTGQKYHFYKAIKLARVIRLPKSAKQSTSFMEMHSQVLSSVWEEGYNLVTIIANLITPPLGLLYLYGVQGVGSSIEAAKEQATNNFFGFIGTVQGKYRVLELRILSHIESEWLRDKIFNEMNYLTVVRGIPKANEGGEDAGNKGMGGKNLNPDSQGTLEDIIAGMADHEYVIQVLSTPVPRKTLIDMQRNVAREMTDWQGQMQGSKSFSMNISMPMMFAANQASSQGWNKAYTNADSVNYSQGESFNTSYGENVGQSLSQTFGNSYTQSHGTTVTNSVSQSQGVTQGTTVGHTVGNTLGQSFGQSINQGLSQNIGRSLGSSVSESLNTSQSASSSHSLGQSSGISAGISQNFGSSQSATNGQTASSSIGQSLSASHGTSASDNFSQSASSSIGSSEGVNASAGHSASQSNGETWSDTHNDGGSITPFGLGVNWGDSHTTGGNSGDTLSQNASTGANAGFNESNSTSLGSGHSVGSTDSFSSGTTNSSSLAQSSSLSYGQTQGVGTSAGESWGVNESYGTNWGNSLGHGQSVGQTQGMSSSMGQSQSFGQTMGLSQSQSISDSVSNSVSQSYSLSQSKSVGQSQSESIGQTVSEGQGRSYGQSQSVGQGQSFSTGRGSSTSLSNGSSGMVSNGISSSMGLGPSIGYNKSYQWLDQEVKDIVEVLEFQNNRLKKALRGEGAFYTYVYIACPTLPALATAMAVAKSTWQNEFALAEPLQVLNLPKQEQQHLLYHMAAFSTDQSTVSVYGKEESKYSTVLIPGEFVAYTHLPRISEGGVFAEVNDIPKFAVPSMLKGEIFMGHVLSAERFTLMRGYQTNYEYRIDEAELMHGFFTGASRSGKTVAAMRFVTELAKVRRKKTGKRLRIVCMDPKRDWRALANEVEIERFNFYSLSQVDFCPIKINPLKIPHGVEPQFWIDGVIDIYCRAYGLLERGKQMMGETIYQLYEEAGVFEARKYDDWRDRVPEKSSAVTFSAVYKRMAKIKAELELPSNPKGKAGNDTRDAYGRLLDRLQAFNRPFSVEHQLFGTSEGIGVDELIGNDDVTVLESSNLENTFRNFIFGVITSGFFKWATAHEKGYLAENQYETVLVIEEANEVLTGNSGAGTGDGGPTLSGESEFERILDQSAGFGLFILAITQKIAAMPQSIIANTGLVFAGKLKRPDDVTTVIRSIAREERIDDRDLVKWFPRSPTGWFVCQSSRGYDFKAAEPILVQIAQINAQAPNDQELLNKLAEKRARTTKKRIGMQSAG